MNIEHCKGCEHLNQDCDRDENYWFSCDMVDEPDINDFKYCPMEITDIIKERNDISN